MPNYPHPLTCARQLALTIPVHHLHALGFAGTTPIGNWTVGPWTASIALLVHTLGYLLVTGLIAVVVYEKLGLDVLRKNLGEFGSDLGRSAYCHRWLYIADSYVGFVSQRIAI
jgi:hypothetical protein